MIRIDEEEKTKPMFFSLVDYSVNVCCKINYLDIESYRPKLDKVRIPLQAFNHKRKGKYFEH